MMEYKTEHFELLGTNGVIMAKGVFVNFIDYGFWIVRKTEKIYYAR
jgi:hypothetical protein